MIATPKGTDAGGPEVLLDVVIVADEDLSRVHYRAVVRLVQRLGSPAGLTVDPLSGNGAVRLPIADAYQQWLFHGPRLQGVEAVEMMAQGGARAILRPSVPGACLDDSPTEAWLIDPVTVDSALQMNVLWARQHWNQTLLPSYLKEYRRFGSFQYTHIVHELRIHPSSQTPFVRADHFFYAPDGRPVGALLGMEGTASAALNRLAATPLG